jgi:MFS family permease
MDVVVGADSVVGTTGSATRRAGTGLIASYVAATFGVSVATLTPLTVTLAVRVQQLDPAHRAGSLSLVLGVGAVLSLVGMPFFGQLSDRTTSRWGMRRPWLVGGLAAGLLGTLVMAFGGSIGALLLGWCVTQGGFCALNAALGALLLDHVPDTQRGRVSGLIGMCQAVAVVVGTFLDQAFAPSIALMFIAPGVVAAVAVIILVLTLPDRRLAADQRPRYDLREFGRSFWVNPIRHPGFGWAWFGRFLLITGFAILQTYLAYYLSGRLGYPEHEVPHLVFQSILTLTGFLVVGAYLSGWLSDRLRRRKMFVLASAALYGVALLVIASANSFGQFLVGMMIAGAGLGAYLAIDLALVAEVLPDGKGKAAKDMGVLNIANTVPQMLAPALAPVALAIGGGNNYPALFIVAAVFSFLGSLAIMPIRGVR